MNKDIIFKCPMCKTINRITIENIPDDITSTYVYIICEKCGEQIEVKVKI